ncbi:unnamed protein product, partial [marine sediment metagenome]
QAGLILNKTQLTAKVITAIIPSPPANLGGGDPNLIIYPVPLTLNWD